MPRNSDLVRSGQAAIPAPETRTQTEPTSEKGPDEGLFSSLPHVTQPPPREIKNFPVFSQLFNEIGTIAEVVDQINRISDFIAGRPPSPPQQTPPQHTQTPPQQNQTPPQQNPPTEQRAHTYTPQAQPRPTTSPIESKPIQPDPPPAPVESDVDVQSLYENLYQFVEGVMQAAQEGRPFSVESGFVLISNAISIAGGLDELYRRAIYTRESSEDHGFSASVVLHSVNVSIYSVKIGLGLAYNRNQLIDLGVAALLHDVGMVTLPPDLFTKGRFTPQDLQVLHQHPEKGRNILLGLGANFQWLAEVAYQEHERENGSGYPQGLVGTSIHEYAKIVGVADIYAGLTRSRPDRHGMLPFEAVKEILQTRKQEFDSRVVRVLLKTLSAFPVGSLVKLNSGAIGRVVDTDTDSPLRPVIAILYDPEGRPVQEAREIRLREHPILHITDTVSPEEVGLA